MKQKFRSALFLSNNKLNIISATLIMLIVGLACGGSKTPPPSQYVGAWTGEDGTLITIRGDGTGDYKASSSITNGTVTIDEAAKTLQITFASMGPTYNIDKAPSGNQMTLSGVVFKKSGGTDSKTDPSSGSVPGDDKLQPLVKTTLLDFNDAVQSGDFSDFHGKLAKPFANQNSPDDLKKAFQTFIDNGFNLEPIKNMQAKFSPAPKMEKLQEYDVLAVEGSYPTKPKTLRFTLKYAEEDGAWKLMGINIKTADS